MSCLHLLNYQRICWQCSTNSICECDQTLSAFDVRVWLHETSSHVQNRFLTTWPTARTPVTGNADRSRKMGLGNGCLLWFPVYTPIQSSWPFTEGWEAAKVQHFFFSLFFFSVSNFVFVVVGFFLSPFLFSLGGIGYSMYTILETSSKKSVFHWESDSQKL